MQMQYNRPHLKTLEARLNEPPKFMVVVAGPRQIGKSTLVRQALSGRPSNFEATDKPISTDFDPFNETATVQTEPGSNFNEKWLINLWTQARAKARSLPSGQFHILAIDEIQKIPRWSEIVKGLWDADRAQQLPLHIVLLRLIAVAYAKGINRELGWTL